MLFVARHGQTLWNAQNKVCGITDIELTAEGIKQAEILANLIRDKNINLIMSSPLKRAVDTGKIISDICDIPITIDDRLIEQNYGVFEGVDRKNESFLNNKRNFAVKYPNGESMMQVAYRIYGLLEEIKSQHKDKNILIITHGGVCRVINTYFKDMSNDEYFNYSMKNGQLEEYEF